MFHEKTAHAARGKWKGILLQLGVPPESLTGKHGPCPMCGGADRFRFDNKDQRGTYICNSCGAGDGMRLATTYTGRTFSTIASEIDGILGNVKPDAPSRPAMSDDERLRALRALSASTKQMAVGDLAHVYLAGRSLDEVVYPKALRFGPAVMDGEGGVRPAMVAVVSDWEGKPVTLHRTFLKSDGSGKAEMTSPRKMMPGEIPDGCAVRLSDFTTGTLGIAEGIETALAASARFGIPVWSAINAGNLAKWIPPEGCDDVAVFGDHDAKFAGQAAAYALARRLAAKGLTVTVNIPPIVGEDWADVYAKGKA